MKNLVIIPFHDFKKAIAEGFRTRDTHIYENFINNESLDKVIIINRPTSLIERILKKKKVLTLKNDVIYQNEYCYIQQLKENVYIIDFFVFDVMEVITKRHSWLPYIYSRNDIIEKVNNALHFLNVQTFSVYMSSPFSVRLGNEINPGYKILDAVDNFSKYENWKFFRNEIHSLYELAKKDYDKIYVNSEDTFNYLKNNCKASLQLVPNGVDSSKFQGSFSRPKDLPQGKIIVGYAGKMQRMFNAGLLAKVAELNPQVDFVLLGVFLDKSWKRKYWNNNLSRFSNIHYLGDKKYTDLPAYYRNFDICMIPYFIEKQHGGDPIKFYEYMACNKPIVSTDIGNIAKYHNNENIIISPNEEEFITGLQRLLSNIYKNKISHEIPIEMEWKTISSQMLDDVFV
ncbi:glycosyltransferase [Salegentibacter flavus]|uniref:Glycosyltransferase involved in cell wall bisynthesis n=1 Tax=Salegentibacter flavus TaxID=287099 RepID=A0A1I5BNY1_9FLAO|nr:glycosyltransferase [Salegentibacter flavus]SFN76494.1 Glycosyltransferase involved in cell wall bisynthesis [Salegentibacter flavus]